MNYNLYKLIYDGGIQIIIGAVPCSAQKDDRMKFDDEDHTYEGIPATVAMGMAMMESTGIRRLIDSVCSDSTVRKLSAGMGVKALVGSMCEERSKPPLYLINLTYEMCPTDLVFGCGVTASTLSDTNLAKTLDSVFDTDMQSLLWKCTDLLCETYDAQSDIYSMDASNYSVYGMGRDAADRDGNIIIGTNPAFGGNSKTNRNDLMQKNVHCVTNGKGILRTSKSFKGNTSDMKMNDSMIEFLKDRVDPEKVIVSADCKLANDVTIDRLLELGWGFVTKAPSNFNDLVKDDIVYSAILGEMDESPEHPGRHLYDTKAEYKGRELRFIAYRLPNGIDDSMEYLTTRGLEIAKKRIAKFKSGKYFCEDDARKAFSDMMERYDGVYSSDAVFEENARLVKKDPDGPHWRGCPGEVSLNADAVRASAERFSVQVLVTDLPFAAEDDGDLRKGASADTVVDLYLGQYYSEKNFRIMKSGMGVNHVYIHTHSRQDAMVFVVSLSTAISNTVDSVLKMSGDERTFRQLEDGFRNCTVEYDRANDTMMFRGPPEKRTDFYHILDLLKTDRRFLLGY